MAKKIPNLLAAAQNAKRKGNNSLLSVAGQKANRRKLDSPERNIANEISYARRSNVNRREDRTLVGQQIAQNAVRNAMARAVTAENAAALSPLERAALNRANELAGRYMSGEATGLSAKQNAQNLAVAGMRKEQPTNAVTPQQMMQNAHRQAINEQIGKTGILPSDYRWLNQGDKAVAVRDFAHKPFEGIESTPKANGSITAAMDYEQTINRANEILASPADDYGNTYADLYASWLHAKDVVSRGAKDPENAPYEYYLLTGDDPNQNIAGMEAKLDGLNRLYAAAERTRPNNVASKDIRSTFAQYANSTGDMAWDKTNYYDQANPTFLAQDKERLQAEKAQLEESIRVLEAGGEDGSTAVENMRNRLSIVDERLAQADTVSLDYKPDFRKVVNEANATLTVPENYNIMNSDANTNALVAVIAPDQYLASHTRANGGLGTSPQAATALPTAYLISSMMTDKERDRFKYLWMTKGADAASEYFRSLEGTTNQRRATGIAEEAYNLGNSNLFGAVGTMGINALLQPAKLLGTAQTGLNALFGMKTDPYSNVFAPTHFSNAASAGARNTVTSPFMRDGNETLASKIAGGAYDVVSNTVNNLATVATTGTLSPFVMAAGAAGDATQDALVRSGGKSGRSFLTGAASGAAEYFTEKIPMEQLSDMLHGKRKGIGALLSHAFLSEAPGEAASELLSGMADNVFMQQYSNYQQNVDKLIASGMSRADANKAATKDFWNGVLYSGVIGGLSGAGSAGVAQGSAALRNAFAPKTDDYQGAVDSIRQLSDVTGDESLRQIADKASIELSHTGKVEAAKQGVVDRMMAAADAVVAKQQSTFGIEESEGVSKFDKPMQATTIDGKGAVNVVGFETTQDGKNVILHTVDQAGNRGTALANELEFADDTVQDLLSADDTKGLDGTGLRNYLSDYASEVNGHSVSAADYAKAYGMLYRRAAAGYSIDQAVQGSAIDMVMTPQAMQDAYAAGVGTGQRVAAPAVQGAMNRSFSTSAWNSMTRQQQRAATANMEVVSQLAKRMNATINIVDSLTDSNGKKLNGRYNNNTGVIEIALDADANAYAYVAMHELTHKMRNEHGNSFKTFAEWVKEALESKGQNFDEMVQHQMDTYGYSKAVATEEVLCNTVPALLQSEENLHKLYQQDRNLFERIMDWVKNLINDIKQAGNVLSERSKSWAQMDALKGDEGTLQALYDVMESIMQSDTETVADAPAGITEQMLEDNVVEGMVQSVMEAPVNVDGEAISYSVSTFEEAMPKPMNMARAKALGFDTGKKSEVVHGLGRYGKKRTLIASGRDVTEALLRKEWSKSKKYKTQEEMDKAVDRVLGYMDKVSEWFKKAVGEYQFVNLADVNEASLIVDRDSGEILFSCQVPNAEYKVNFDFTTVCRQREAVQRFVDELSQEKGKRGTKLEDITLTPSNIFKLNTILKDAGYETACLGCFVEAKRYRIMSQANTIVDEWNAAVRKLNPKAEYFNFADKNASLTQDEIIKLDAEMEGHRQKVKDTDKNERAKTPTARAETLIGNVPEMQRLIRPSDIISRSGRRKIRETSPALESFLVSRFGTAGAKPAVGFMPYNSEIAALPDTKSLGKGKGSISVAEYLFRLGGARSNSFSDFIPTHALDYLQRTIDMAARGFTGQCYTKVLGRAMLFGMTGEKINLSVMFDIDPDVHWANAGLDADGNYIVADKARADRMEAEGKGRTFVQSFPYEEAIRIEHDPRYADNCGIIGVGYSYRHIEKMLADNNIPYVIPYHRSNMPDNVAKASHTGHATNYEPVQNTKTITGYQRVYNMEDSDGIPSYATWPEKLKNARKVDMDFDFAAAMKRNGGNAKATITEWQNWMAENNLTPMTTAGEAGHGDFDLYGSLRRTQDPDATAEEYMKYCIDKGMLPVFYEFAQMDGYYKTLFDFSVRNLATGEVALQKPVSLDFMDSFRYEDFLSELDAEMFEYNEYNKQRFGSQSWEQLKERAYRELQPTEEEIEEGEVFSNSVSDFDENIAESEVVLEDLLTMTAAHKMTDAEAGRMARNVVKTASGTMDTGEVAQRIKTIFDYATRSGERLDVNGLNSEVRALADEIMQRSETLDTEHESEVADLRAYLRKTPIVLSDSQKSEAASMIGSYAAYRRALFGQVSLRKNGIGLDQVWGELSEMYPQLFPKDTTEGDQVRLLMEAAEYAKPVYVNEYGFNAEEAVQWLSNEIFNSYMSLSGVQRAAKEQKELGLKLGQYRKLTKRFASEHKAAYDEAYAKVTSEAESRIAKAEAKAELMANKAISEAQADADYRVIQAKKDIKAKVEARVSTFVEKFNEAERRKRYQAQIVREANSLMKRLEHPTDKSHIQDALQQHVIDFLRDLRIGSRSKRALSLGYRIKELKDVLANPVGNDGSDGGYRYIVDQQLLEEFDLMAKEMEYIHTIDRLDADGMANIRDLVHALVHIVNKADETFAGERKKRISESAELFVAQTDSRKDVKVRDDVLQPVTNFLQVRNLDSFHFFDRLGGEAREMFQQLRNGYDKKIMRRAEAMEFVAGLNIDKKAKKDLFSGKRAKKTTYNLDGGSIELSRAQLMELYCLNKREQARKHIYSEKGGIRTMDGRRVTIRQAEMNKLLDNLTAEEKMLADSLQRYLSTECSEWGNETSMTLYGYRKFGEENYWPIRVDGNSIDSNNSMEGKQDNLYALLNMGMTKATLDTVQNAIYIGDIFDTFARHIDNMATYNGLAAPIADLVRWFNYRSGDTNVKEAINFKFGKQYLAYIPQLIRDINGDTGKQDTSSPFDKLFSNAKSSAVGRNVRVLIQQPTALMRAGSMMDYKYIMLGMTGIKGENGRIKLKEASELAKKYCPIAVLKSMGFHETDMGRSMRTAMFDNRTNLEKVKDEGMWMAGKLDEMTFSALWRACEAETRSVHSDLAVGSEEYYKAVGKRMGEIIDYTQVVDTPLHRTEVMRGKDGLQKIVTSFMAEPSKTYNMLYNATMDLIEKRHDPVARHRFVKTMGAFGVTAIVNAAAQSLVDAMRNDDDEEWWKRFCKAFFGDWSNVKTLRDAFRAYMSGNLYDGFDITGMIPYIKDLMSMLQGYDVKRTDLQSVEKLIQVYQNVAKLWNGENKLSGWSWAKQIATSIDSVTGLSLNNALRDGGAFVNLMFEIVGAEPPLKTYHETATPGIAYDNMMAALESGDTKAFERIQAKTGKTNKEVDTEMGNLLAEREDERIVAAYEAKASGRASEYDRLRTEFVEQHGDVVGAERAEEIFDKAAKRYKAIVEDTDEPSDEKDTSPLRVTAYTNKEMGEVFYGLATGTTSRADAELVLSEMIADSTAKDPEKTVRSNLLSQLKPLYIAAPTEEERKAIGEVIKEFCGKTDKDLKKYIEGK
jgi:hypothetical protein